MSDLERNSFQQTISLLDYLKRHGWQPTREDGKEEVCGLCPLHRETEPSFYVNRRKQVFYCHGCQRGGGIVQLRRWLESSAPGCVNTDRTELLEAAYRFYQQQLVRSPEARVYLRQRGIQDPTVVEQMRIGYAPGACLRGYLSHQGYSCRAMLEAGLIGPQGRDRLFGCLTFPLPEAMSLYGRSIDSGRWRHQFLRGPKGGLYGWMRAQTFSSVIVVEGLLDVAALWQAGFRQAVAALGSHLNPAQVAQLGEGPHRRVHICFDADWNGSGQRAARQLSRRLGGMDIEALLVDLPCGCDPAGWFAAGGLATDFQHLLESARP